MINHDKIFGLRNFRGTCSSEKIDAITKGMQRNMNK